MSIKEKLEEGYLFGCIKYKGQCSLYFMPIAYWILDYKTYDPTYNPDDWDFIFRNNILVVNDANLDGYLEAIQDDIVDPVLFVKGSYKLIFFVDFDGKVFVSSFSDIEAEEYLPKDWQGKYDNPISYLPDKYKMILGVD